MAIVDTRVTVLTAAIAVAAAGTTGSGDAVRVNVRNRGAIAVYLGGAAVTSSTGYQLDPGESVSTWLEAGETMYGISASSSVVHVLTGGA